MERHTSVHSKDLMALGAGLMLMLAGSPKSQKTREGYRALFVYFVLFFNELALCF